MRACTMSRWTIRGCDWWIFSIFSETGRRMRTIRATTTSNRRTTTSATVSGWERRSSTVSAQASSIRFRIIMRSPRRISTDGSQSASTSYVITTKAGRTVIHGKSSTGKSGTNPMPNRTCGAVTTNCIMSCMHAPRNGSGSVFPM